MNVRILLLLSALSVVSCSLPSPQNRIADNGGMYSKLTPEHRQLVSQGNIEEGMSKDAVYLAWGAPDKIFQGEKNGIDKERWVYTRSRPVHTTTLGLGYGTYPRYRRWGYDGCVYHGVPDTVYVPERVAMVEFINDVVDSWERTNQNPL